MVPRSDRENEAVNEDGSVDPDDDERVGEAIEAYLALAEQGAAPDIEEFAARYPDLKDDVRAGLEGLELVHGLLGLGSCRDQGRAGDRSSIIASNPAAGSPATVLCASWGAAAWARFTKQCTWGLIARWLSRFWASTPRPTPRPGGDS